jgi:hypothetical protein
MTISPSNILICISLVIYQLTAVPSMAINGKYPIKNFTPADYKAGIQNIDFAQNRAMNLFVANNLGVLPSTEMRGKSTLSTQERSNDRLPLMKARTDSM